MPPRCTTPNTPKPRDKGWLHYVEPYFGGGAVLLANDPEGISEVVNDINVGLTNFWSVLQDKKAFAAMLRQVQATPFSQVEFAKSEHRTKLQILDVDHAVKFFVHCRQSMSGRMKDFAPLTRNRVRRGMNEQASAWLNAIDGLREVHERLRSVVILNEPALKVIKKEDGKRTLYYLDPPYLPETRKSTGEYAHEMTVKDHEELLDLLGTIEGRFMLSGYPSPLYAAAAKKNNWTCHKFDMANHAAGGTEKRRMVECLWCNY